MHFIYKWRKKRRFLTEDSLKHQPAKASGNADEAREPQSVPRHPDAAAAVVLLPYRPKDRAPPAAMMHARTPQRHQPTHRSIMMMMMQKEGKQVSVHCGRHP